MSNRILVAYATRTGSTQGIAEAIADTLRDHGATVDVSPVADVTDITPYDAVVAGSAIRAASWLPEALDFLNTHQHQLQQKPVAVFATCMTVTLSNTSAREKVSTFLDPVREVITPVSEGYFAGILDLKKIENKQARWGFRLSVWMQVWKQGDYRDWGHIRAWTTETQPLLMQP